MKTKLTFIFLPFVIISAAFTLLYPLLCWLLFTRLRLADPPEDLIDFWLPFALPLIPLLIWLRPRIKLLKLKRSGRNNPDTAYAFLASFAIAASTIVAVKYMHTASGHISNLQSTDSLATQQPSKYYTIQNVYVDRFNKGVQYSSEVTGRSSNYLDLMICIACPLYDKSRQPAYNDTETVHIGTIETYNPKQLKSTFLLSEKKPLVMLDGSPIDSAALMTFPVDSIASYEFIKAAPAMDLYGAKAVNGVLDIVSLNNSNTVEPPPEMTLAAAPKAWLCVSYTKQISNRLNEANEKEAEHSFYHEAMNRFADSDVESFVYLDRIGNNKLREHYIKAIAKTPVAKGLAPQLILEPRFEPFEKRNGSMFLWIFGAFTIGSTVMFLLIIIPKLDDEKYAAFISGEKAVPKGTGIREALVLFIPRKNFYVTPLIIDANLFVFLAMIASGNGFLSFDTSVLIHWGGNFKSLTTGGQWWRLLTSAFVHDGFLHIFMNMYALLFVGVFLEPVLKRTTYITCYLATAVAASFTSLWWHNNTVSVGASGAIFGLYGVFLALLLNKVFPQSAGKAFLIGTLVFIGYNLLAGLTGNIDNAAHIGGLVSGFLIGLYLSPVVKRKALWHDEAQ